MAIESLAVRGVRLLSEDRDLERRFPGYPAFFPGRQAATTALAVGISVVMMAAPVRAQTTEAQEGRPRQSTPENDPSTADTGEPDDARVDDIIVTGTNVRGVTSLPTFMTSASRADIAATGRMTTEEFFKTLPQNFAGLASAAYRSDNNSRLSNINGDRAAAVDLRGLGADSTLTLVNGTRRAGSVNGRVVDISTIPLSAIERIDIVTGGRSAVYGSDAVAGVVNLIMRQDFEGLETQIGYGGAREGGDRLQASAIGGVKGASGGFVIAYDYTRENAFDVVRAGLTAPTIKPLPFPPFTLVEDLVTLRADAQPRGERHALFAAGHLNLSDNLEVYADGQLTRKTYYSTIRELHFGASDESFENDDFGTTNYNFKLGSRLAIGRWSADLSGSKSQVNSKTRTDQLYSDFSGTTALNTIDRSKADLSVITLVADGPLPSIGGLSPKLSIGSEARWEKYRRSKDGAVRNDDKRSIFSIFGELVLPFSESESHSLTKFDLFLGARYDRYQDFGSTFNPQAGVVWSPLAGLQIKGGLSRAYRAPALAELGTGRTAQIQNLSDPVLGASPVMVIGGDNPGLGSEKATTWSLGLDWKPSSIRGLRVSVNYFNISYRDRINSPAPGFDALLALEQSERYPGLIDRRPTDGGIATLLAGLPAEEIINNSGIPWDIAGQSLLQAIPNLIVFDNRTNNISKETVHGLDFSTSLDLAMGDARFQLGVDGTYTISHKGRLTSVSPLVSSIDQVGLPADLRLRGKVAAIRGAVSLQAFVNYVDGYRNQFAETPSRIGSWTTVDLNVTIDASAIGKGSVLDGLSLSVNAENILDTRPPYFDGRAAFTGNIYDPANASPFGRYLSIRVTKKW